MTHADNVAPPLDPRSFVGTWRRFGDLGPVYEVLAFDRHLDDLNCLMRIRVLESGEELDYTLAELLADPAEL